MGGGHVRVKDTVESVLLGALSLCAVVVTILFVKRELSPVSAGVGQLREVTEWRDYVHGIEYLGPATARDTIIVFSDFQCPFCAQLAQSLAQIEASGEHSILVVHRNLPIPELHPFARAAAIAGVCAARQNQFDAFYHRLFQYQDDIPTIEWAALATNIGVKDTILFRACLGAESTVLELAADSVAAEELHIGGTPTMLVGPHLVFGALPPDSILALLE